MTEDIYADLIARLDVVAAKMGTAAEHLWPVLVRQQVIAGSVALGITALAWMGLGLAWWALARRLRKNAGVSFGDIPEHLFAGCYGCGVASVAVIILTFALLPRSIGQVLNPEYRAAMDLLEILK